VASDPLYVFYTSGTTGRPKGVVVEHLGLCHRINWLQNEYPLDRDSVLLQKAACGFGVSEWEFFWPLTCGGASLVMADPGGHRDAQYLHDTITNEKCTHLFFVPSLLTVLLEHLALEAAGTLTAPQHVFCVGEALLPQTAALFFGAFAGAELHNLYGPTEADMTYFQIPRGGVGARARVPAGAPIENSEVYVLDRFLDPVPLGLPGEMCFGGVGTARGYLNLPELTGQSFVANPYGPGRLYRTGDVGRWSHDRTLEYLGRLDHQVKLRGFRIELGEIESQIRRVDDQVTAVTVVVLGDDPATQRLVAYVTPANVRPREIIAALRNELPEYSVPSTVVPLGEMPLNSNGKVDRRALPPPESTPGHPGNGGGSGGGGGEAVVLPQTMLEAAVREVWAGVLGLDPGRISTDADFATIGGNSLLTGKATSRIRAHVGARIPGTAMYQHPTIRGLSRYIEEQGLTPAVLGDGTGKCGSGDGGGSSGSGGSGSGSGNGAPLAVASTLGAHTRWRGKDAHAPFAMAFQFVGAAVCCAIEAVFHIMEWIVILFLYTTLSRRALFIAVPLVPLIILPPSVALYVPVRRTPHAAPCAPHATPRTPHSAPHIPHATPRTPHAAPHIPHATPRTPHAAPHIPNATPRTPHAAPHIPHATPRTPHAAPHIPHATPRTPPAAPHIPHATPRTPHAAPHIPHATPRTPHAAPHIPHPVSSTPTPEF
jgi:amino acid adenylation domain-containing protein